MGRHAATASAPAQEQTSRPEFTRWLCPRGQSLVVGAVNRLADLALEAVGRRGVDVLIPGRQLGPSIRNDDMQAD